MALLGGFLAHANVLGARLFAEIIGGHWSEIWPRTKSARNKILNRLVSNWLLSQLRSAQRFVLLVENIGVPDTARTSDLCLRREPFSID